MKLTDAPITTPTTIDGRTARSAAWRGALTVFCLSLLGLILCYWDAVVSMVLTWERTGTYAHGFVVYPVAAWLIWRQRDRVAALAPRPFLPAIVLLAAFSIVWLGGHLTNTQTLREFAFVFSVPALVWAVLGTQVARALAFPLLMSLFALPIGEFLIPPMIDYTADFTVAALRLTGVPVYRENNFFTIPTGNWSVVAACSGIRYLIASVYGGAIFAYLNFRSRRRQALFMAAAVIVPIVANWLRAYIIVMLGHLSNNRIAGGVDHLIYGWIFFGIVIMILFYVGSRFSDIGRSEVASPPSTSNPSIPGLEPSASAIPRGRIAATGVVAVLLAAIGPGIALGVSRNAETAGRSVAVSLPSNVQGWVSGASVIEWEPSVEPPSFASHVRYTKDDTEVGVHLAYYSGRDGGGKTLTYASTALFDYNARNWRVLGRQEMEAATGMPIIERRLSVSNRNVLSWQWFWVGRTNTISVWEGKLAEAKARLQGLGDDGANIVIYAPYGEDPAVARAALQAFVREAHPEIERSLRHAADG